MRVLVACEESQAVCKAFRAKGHEAYSADLQECSGGHPEWHIKGDCLKLINGNCTFMTEGGQWVHIEGSWDLVIAHPPCTDLAVSGAKWFSEKQKDFRQQKACVFFMRMMLCNAERIAVENPIGIMSTCYRKPDQIIQPWQYANDVTESTLKSTCLWLKNLPKLKPKNTEKPEIKYHVTKSGKRMTEWYYNTRRLSVGEKGKAASKTFVGIAEAMADQWGKLDG